MRNRPALATVLILTVIAVGATLACSDSPTDTGSAPVIAQLQVGSVIRATGNEGLVGLTFQYTDPDADLRNIVFQVVGDGTATNPLTGAGQTSGQVSVQQAVTLPAAGTQVDFAVSVVDRRANQSNVLMGSFVTP